MTAPNTVPTWHHYPEMETGQTRQMPIFAMWAGVQARPPVVEATRAVPFELIETDGLSWVGRIPRDPDELPHPIEEGDVVAVWTPCPREGWSAPQLVRAVVRYIEPDPDAPPRWTPGAPAKLLRVDRPHVMHVDVEQW